MKDRAWYLDCMGVYDRWPGQCCCKCSHQRIIEKHPWNGGKAKGPCSEIFGYGCDVGKVIDNNPKARITFFDRAHSLCELYDGPKPKIFRWLEA